LAITLLRFDMRSPAFSPASTAELYAAALDMAAWADEKNFDSLSLSEHHGTDDGFLPSPIAMLGCLVGRTRRIRIGVAALLLPLYDPVKLAEDLVVLDIASGGRIAVTLGLGYRPEEYEAFGQSWEKRGERMDECLEVLLKAFTGEPFEYRGHRVRVTPRPSSRPHPMVMVGGMGKNAARRAARFGLPFQPAVNTPEVLELYRRECRERNVAPLVLPPGSGEMLWIARDPDRLWSQIGPHLLHDARTYASWQPAGQRSAVHSDATTALELRAEGKYRILTPEACIERARAQGPLAACMLFPLCGGIPPKLAWEGLELFASEVMPHLPAMGRPGGGGGEHGRSPSEPLE
jgi:alkanesulfonate monooxygenase SsuD/methylene tetrahydromethanopterin reductase-like flavin-dependent oxidoreductase (luciferase family)